MYLRILKKDIKRKKTMNVILLLFVILSAMFAASSVNNIVTVMNGIDYFFDKAGMTDFYYATQGAEAEKTVEQFLKDNKNVSDYGSEQVLFISSDN
ncbi:MAG: ABC transporter permease, partial [Ruminococcus sp.]|nr:ABC transporter permease [Ruminococcus sp.]